ncbi:MAG: restriction endonuclease subunit S [Acutalibacter sp.]|nr:restriction endonuclease subunit S [Acutalibacter sp.]
MTAQDLKNSILQCAIQGKLVPQDDMDEPVSELLKRLQAVNGIIAPSLLEDMPFEIPTTWNWVKLGSLIEVIGGTTYKSHEVSKTGIRIFRGGNLQNSNLVYYDNDVFLPPTFYAEEKTLHYGDVVIVASTGSKIAIGKPAFVRADDRNTQIGAFLRIIRPKFAEFIPYFWALFDSEFYRKHIRESVQGMNINNVKAEYLTEFIIPIPPLEEQKRIVSKIGELLPIVAEYGEAEQRLSALNAEFPDKLRKSILQQAVQGKLTERDPADEPASELLKRIREEKVKLIAEGKIKKEKTMPPISEDECPFEIPDTWTWVHLQDICSLIGDIDHNMPKSVNPEEGVLFLSAKDLLDDGTINYTNNVKYISQNDFVRLSKKVLPCRNDIIYSRIGAALGKARVVESDITFLVSYSCCVIRPLYVDIWFLRYYLESPYILSYSVKARQSIGVPDLGMGEIKKYLVALPPLAEQKRIVDRVNELLSVCDGLK